METRMRAYKYALDPSPSQLALMRQYAGAARYAYNLLVAENKQRGDRYAMLRDHLKTRGMSPADIKKAIVEHDGLFPGEQCRTVGYQKYSTESLTPLRVAHEAAAARIANGESPESACADIPFDEPWLHEIPRRVLVSGLIDANKATANWFDSITGKRKGRRVGAPRFKKKGRSRDSFTIPRPEAMGPRSTYKKDVNGHTRPITDYRHLRLASLGAVRTHQSTKRLVRALDRGAEMTSFTVSRHGDRWYASVLTQESVEPAGPTRRQRARGGVGVDVGVSVQAALSTGETVDNIRPGASAARRITKLQQAIARCEKGSNRQARLYRRLAKAQHLVAQQRATAQHRLTKRLAAEFADVAIEDLQVSGMTASARGTVEAPGRNVRAKSGLNRSILDVGFGEIRRQLEYKTGWYGSRLHIIDRYAPSSKTCHACGASKAKMPLHVRDFVCDCGYMADRGVNAARNIAVFAGLAVDAGHLADGRSESGNGRGARSGASRVRGAAGSGLDAPRPSPRGRSPVRSDPDLIPNA